MTTDCELLATFARTNSEDAFAEVMKRHVNLVYSAALRQTGGDAHLAKDVAQNVFTDLAHKAASLSRRDNLSRWLYASVHFAAAKIVRTESRRRDREEKFMRESDPENSAGAPPAAALENEWRQVAAALDVPQLDPRFHTLETSTKANVWDGQTLVFQPSWKQDPNDAFLQSTKNPDTLRTMMLVFVTVNIVDSAGLLKYQDDETNTAIPPQPDPASN